MVYLKLNYKILHNLAIIFPKNSARNYYMFLNKSFPYDSSSRTHIFIGSILGMFVLFIIFFLKPFDSGGSSFSYKTIFFLIYGLIIFITYFASHLVSIFYYKRTQSWKLFEEIIFCLLFIVVSIVLGFFYTEKIINKNPDRINMYHFLGWFKTIFSSFGTLLFILTIVLRKKYTDASLKHAPADLKSDNLMKSKSITITSSLKKEDFTVDEANIVYIKSESNYVLISFSDNNELKEKLLRSTLSNVSAQLPTFIKIHRSYIVNPNFILSLKGSKQNAKLQLKDLDLTIPVSETYFETVNSAVNRPR